jgi:hypothetical protein
MGCHDFMTQQEAEEHNPLTHLSKIQHTSSSPGLPSLSKGRAKSGLMQTTLSS